MKLEYLEVLILETLQISLLSMSTDMWKFKTIWWSKILEILETKILEII